MPQDNLISAAISAENQQAITLDINNIHQKLSDILIFNLTPDDRMSLPKMGDRSMAFVDKSVQYAIQNTALVPSFLDVAEMQKDYALARSLYAVLQQLNTLTRSVEDAMMVSGSEAYNASLIFYKAVQGASRSNVAGSQAIANDLQSQFPKKTVKAAQTAKTPL